MTEKFILSWELMMGAQRRKSSAWDMVSFESEGVFAYVRVKCLS